MKHCLTALALVLATASPAWASSSTLELDCQQSVGECRKTWNGVQGGSPVHVTLKCKDGSLDKQDVTATSAVTCSAQKTDFKTYETYTCNQQSKDVGYSVTAHLKCQ
ncbi:hypothetical protein [Bauldia sp.]|uniref:hypothetical protein n=1 Tax=Bauldia sp. TaxID=2575872 RepID=UPI003BAA9AEA